MDWCKKRGTSKTISFWHCGWARFAPTIQSVPITHPAAHYLVHDRGFDLQELAAQYDVRYCQGGWGGDAQAGNRIVIPVRQDGQLMGWQARYIGELEWNAWEPKYKFPRGMKKSRLLYNIDAATGAAVTSEPTAVFARATGVVTSGAVEAIAAEAAGAAFATDAAGGAASGFFGGAGFNESRIFSAAA